MIGRAEGSPVAMPQNLRESTARGAHSMRLRLFTTVIVLAAVSAILAQSRAPQAVATGRTPKAAATAALELVRSTFPIDARDDLTSHTFLASNVDALQRAAQAVIDDDGTDAAAAPSKINVLVHDLTNAANTAVNIAGRPRQTPQIKRKFEQFATALRAISSDLLAMTLPVSAGNASRTAISDASPAKQAAAAALDLAQSTRRDDTYVGPRLHTFLGTNLTTLERAAQAVIDDDGRTATATTAKLYALSSALDATAKNAVDIGGRSNETAETKSKSKQLNTAARTISARLDVVLRPDFHIQIPREVAPETVRVFFALSASGVLPDESVRTRSGVYDYTIPIRGERFLRLLIYIPGFQMVTAEFKDGQLDPSKAYTPVLARLPAVRLDGRLTDSSGQPMRNQTLDLSYELSEAVRFFCGNCRIDDRIPRIEFEQARTDDTGAFTFNVANVRDDPFFQRYSPPGEEPFALRAQTSQGMTGDVLRPSRFSAETADKKPFVVTQVERRTLSGRVGLGEDGSYNALLRADAAVAAAKHVRLLTERTLTAARLKPAQGEPTRPARYAIMSPRRAAPLKRSADEKQQQSG